MSNQETGDRDTAEFKPQRAKNHSDRTRTDQVEVDLAAQSHRGHVRTNNEDHYLQSELLAPLKLYFTNLGEFLRTALTKLHMEC